MANYSCANGHTWKAKSSLSPSFTPAELLCPKDDCGLPSEGLKARRSGGTQRSAPESTVLDEAHARFTQLVTEWPCFFADTVAGAPRRPDHQCWPKNQRDPHHLLPASWIKDRFGDLPDPELADILYAPIIGTPLCRKAHEAVEARSDYIYFHELDPELIDWCQRIEAKYPGRPSVLERLKLESPVREGAR